METRMYEAIEQYEREIQELKRTVDEMEENQERHAREATAVLGATAR